MDRREGAACVVGWRGGAVARWLGIQGSSSRPEKDLKASSGPKGLLNRRRFPLSALLTHSPAVFTTLLACLDLVLCASHLCANSVSGRNRGKGQ